MSLPPKFLSFSRFSRALNWRDDQDIGNVDDVERLVKQTLEQLGGLDIVINNAGWTRFATFGDLHDLSHDEWNKCWAVNVMSQLFLMQQVTPVFKDNTDGGVFIITSSIAGVSVGGSSMGYCVTKAAGLRLMKCLASTQGPKIRVNAVLPGLLLTEWVILDVQGMQFPEASRNAGIQKAALKQEV
ncbi:3-oxoacyl-[acyl-carrier protein] reductase [Exophiala aquamarina CBS 119918]|uniref:3-oxoacyl-[acyl-carrier protein] reductase n=1 Tax=Exophiala aquamarina CBS 119918 TaxID=1182545 RepID=A0A072PQD1_9EURO|nr:3-oxoacyl-[acyl-carrier protein] reductase [Exophiala aquamarina CBS 119918]KEF61558.1 3-oxoacyl-[acyl-carrier protein] reductase [Exophiala aquamarina CBS 119918]